MCEPGVAWLPLGSGPALEPPAARGGGATPRKVIHSPGAPAARRARRRDSSHKPERRVQPPSGKGEVINLALLGGRLVREQRSNARKGGALGAVRGALSPFQPRRQPNQSS